MPTALITGTSTGIGGAGAARLAAHGWTVYAGVRRAEDGDRLTTNHPGDIRPVILDVTNRDDMQRVVADITDDVGSRGLQGLVNNAGAGAGGPVEYVTEADWRWVFDVNFFAVVALSQATIPMLRAGRGRIVHIGSIGGRVASAGLGPYAATKHALEALTETMRLEFARSGTPIRVSLVEPGSVKTPIWDKSDATADELASSFDPATRERYGWLVDQARGFIDEGREKGVPAGAVAEVVEHALTANRPKARYLVGPDAKLVGNVVARLPDWLREQMLMFAAKRYEQRGRDITRSRPT
jgi:NAD(P)-dependent dehydrogenase (short-subunit alcohol dehydrogenase family)